MEKKAISADQVRFGAGNSGDGTEPIAAGKFAIVEVIPPARENRTGGRERAGRDRCPRYCELGRPNSQLGRPPRPKVARAAAVECGCLDSFDRPAKIERHCRRIASDHRDAGRRGPMMAQCDLVVHLVAAAMGPLSLGILPSGEETMSYRHDVRTAVLLLCGGIEIDPMAISAATPARLKRLDDAILRVAGETEGRSA